MKLNEAVSKRLLELLDERKMTQYQLYMKSGVLQLTLSTIMSCTYPSMKLRLEMSSTARMIRLSYGSFMRCAKEWGLG